MSLLVLAPAEAERVRCKRCRSRRLERLMSRFAYHQSECDRLEAFDTAGTQSESFYRDSRNVGLRAKKRAREMGVDLGLQFEETLEKARSGKILGDL